MAKERSPRQKLLARRRSQRYYLRCKKRKQKFAELVKESNEILENQPEFYDTRSVWDILDQKPKVMKRHPGRPRKEEVT